MRSMCPGTLIITCSMKRSWLHVSIDTLTNGLDMTYLFPNDPTTDPRGSDVPLEIHPIFFRTGLSERRLGEGQACGATDASGPAAQTMRRCRAPAPCVSPAPPNDNNLAGARWE